MTGTDALPAARAPRILAIHRYFWPDTPPYATMLRRILETMSEAGHEVDVLSSQPSYKQALDNEPRPATERLDGLTVRRLRLPNETGRPIVRMFNALRLCGAIILRALRKRYETIIISTSPPVVGGVAAALAAKLTGARLVFHCMDIHPEVGRVSGEFSSPWVFRLLRRLDTWTCQVADPVVVLSDDMAQTLRDRPGARNLNIAVQNNFALPSDDAPSTALPYNPAPGTLTVLFAGNVGRFQGLETAIDAMALLRDRDDIEFIIMGDGAAKSDLERRAMQHKARVRFLGHQPVAVAKAAMRQADLGYVSLVPDIYRFAFPSKTMTYLGEGCPLIVAVERHSELARDAELGGYGLWTAPNDADTLARLLTGLAGDTSRLRNMSERALDKARIDYAESTAMAAWRRILAARTTDPTAE